MVLLIASQIKFSDLCPILLDLPVSILLSGDTHEIPICFTTAYCRESFESEFHAEKSNKEYLTYVTEVKYGNG